MFKNPVLLSATVIILAISIALTSCSSSEKELPAPEKLNVMIIMVDTLAKKHTSTYCESCKSYTPELDKFAKEAVVFSNAYSTSSWTKPAITSALTGLMPSQHGTKRIDHKLSKDLYTLPERFKKLGHTTYGVYSHSLLESKYGYAQGFDTYINAIKGHKPHLAISSKWVTDLTIKELNKHQESSPDSPFFFFAHYFDPHYFYQEHKEFNLTGDYKGQLESGLHITKLRELSSSFTPEDTEYLVNLHHEEIAYTDKHLGRLFQHLKTSGLDKNTLILFVADHGEEFMEHNWIGHTKTLYQELINIPFMVRLPGAFNTGKTDVPVSLLDIVPTVLRTTEAGWQGKDLSPWLTGKKSFSEYPKRDMIAEVDFKSSKKIKDAKMQCLVRDNLKLVHDQHLNTYQLFSIRTPEDELTDLSEQRPEKVKELKAALENWRKNLTSEAKSTKVDIDDTEVEQLQSLGYM